MDECYEIDQYHWYVRCKKYKTTRKSKNKSKIETKLQIERKRRRYNPKKNNLLEGLTCHEYYYELFLKIIMWGVLIQLDV